MIINISKELKTTTETKAFLLEVLNFENDRVDTQILNYKTQFRNNKERIEIKITFHDKNLETWLGLVPEDEIIFEVNSYRKGLITERINDIIELEWEK